MTAPFDPMLTRPTLTRGERLCFVLSHAILPLCVLALVTGTLVWGPYVGLAITTCAWRFVTRLA